MRELILETSRFINFLRTVLQEVGEIPLQLFQIVDRRIDCAGTTLGFPNLEGVIFILLYVQYVAKVDALYLRRAATSCSEVADLRDWSTDMSESDL